MIEESRILPLSTETSASEHGVEPSALETVLPSVLPGTQKSASSAISDSRAPARFADYPRCASGRKTPLALRRFLLSGGTSGRQLRSDDLSTQLSTWCSGIASVLDRFRACGKSRTRLASLICVRATLRLAEMPRDDRRQSWSVMASFADNSVSSRRTPDVHIYTQVSHGSSKFCRRLPIIHPTN